MDPNKSHEFDQLDILSSISHVFRRLLQLSNLHLYWLHHLRCQLRSFAFPDIYCTIHRQVAHQTPMVLPKFVSCHLPWYCLMVQVGGTASHIWSATPQKSKPTNQLQRVVRFEFPPVLLKIEGRTMHRRPFEGPVASSQRSDRMPGMWPEIEVHRPGVHRRMWPETQ